MPARVRPAAAARADAMDLSDAWVEAGCDLDSPLVAQERAALVRSYALLLGAVHRLPPPAVEPQVAGVVPGSAAAR